MRYVNLIFKFYNYINFLLSPHYIAEQGEMFGLICDYFAVDKYGSMSPYLNCRPGHVLKWSIRKTNRSTNPPIKFRGWKGSR